MKLWDDFYTYYLADVTGCTYFAAVNELRRAAQELCERAKVWRVELDPVRTMAGQSVYDFELTGDQELVKVMEARLNDIELDIIIPGKKPRGFLALQPLNSREFKLFPEPITGLRVDMTAILKPSDTSEGIEDHLYAQYAEKIAYGAKARLFAQPGKPYTNPALAAAFEQKFADAVADANWRAEKAYSNAPQRVKAQFF